MDTALETADSFFEPIFKNHGLPGSPVRHVDAKFRSDFWSRVIKRSALQLNTTPIRHPQTDRPSSIMYQMVERYLKCYCPYKQKSWDERRPTVWFLHKYMVSNELRVPRLELDLGWILKLPLYHTFQCKILSNSWISFIQSGKHYWKTHNTRRDLLRLVKLQYSRRDTKIPFYQAQSKSLINKRYTVSHTLNCRD